MSVSVTQGRAGGGVLERGEGLVFGEALGEVLGRLRVEVVVPQAANESRIAVLWAADTFVSVRVGKMADARRT